MAKVLFPMEIEKCTDKPNGVGCPFVHSERTQGAGFAVDYWCNGTKTPRKIIGYIEWDSEIPPVPEWCPYRVN